MRNKRILVFARNTVGGVDTFWRNVPGGDPDVDIVRFEPGAVTKFEADRRLLVMDPFAPLVSVYEYLAENLPLDRYQCFVANQSFDAGFLAWARPQGTVSFVVHSNHDDSYAPALKYRNAIDHFFCVSETGASYLRPRCGERVTAFQYAIDLPAPAAVPKKRKAIYVGRLEADKNLAETARLFRVLGAAGYETKFIGDGSLRASLQGEFGADSVLSGLSREEIFPHFAEAKFLLLNSYLEGLPIVYFEAMHFGCGVVCSTIDQTIHSVLGGNYILADDDARLLEQMERFVFQAPPAPLRSSNPALNAAFLQQIRNVPPRSGPRESILPDSVLDRRLPVPSRWVSAFRRMRWRGRGNIGKS
jgi:glycosyltransferase involved in cell wall biosynthesis